jgi:hypothetical protein
MTVISLDEWGKDDTLIVHEFLDRKKSGREAWGSGGVLALDG